MQQQFQQYPMRSFFVTPVTNKKKRKSAKVDAQAAEEGGATTAI